MIKIGAASLALLLLLATPALAQNWPAKPVRVVVAFGPGGIADTIARAVGLKLAERFGQSFVIENRGGAGGTLGAKLVVAAAPDGHTLLVHTAASAINATASKEAPDPLVDLTPVAIAASAATIFAVHASNSASALREFVDKRGRFTFATAGVGTSEHLTGEFVFRTIAKLDATHVPYQGGVAPVNAVLGQQVDLASTTLPTAFAHVKQGTLKVLAVASRARLPQLPDVPTLAETGLADFENASWIAFFAPAKIPPAIVTALNGAINQALAEPDVRERLATIGLDIRTDSSAGFSEYLRGEIAKWGRVIKATGITPN